MIGFPTGHSGRSKLSRRDIMLALPVDRQSISCRATDESPGKISLSTKQPAQSSILICERRAVGKNFANFCRSVDSNRCQHLQYLAKGRNQRPATRVTGGALPLPTIQYLFTISLAKTQTDSDGVVRMCSFSSPLFRGTQGRRVTFPVCSLRALE